MSYEILSKNDTDISEDILVIDEIPDYSIQDYDIFDEKDYPKYIQDIEKIVRASMEYREFINYLRTYMNMNKCSFFKDVSNIDTFKIKIEIHHHPFTLYDIVVTIFNKRAFYNESLEVEMVAKEAMYVHYFLMIGLIPLAETVHELVHEQLLFIPLDKVMGNYEEFKETYKEFVPEECLDKLKYLDEQTRIYNEEANLDILKQNIISVHIPHEDGLGTYKLPDMDKLSNLMSTRITQLKESNRAKLECKSNDYDNNIIDVNDETLVCPVYYK